MPIDVEFEEISERITIIREARGRNDDTLRDLTRASAVQVFTGLIGRVQNEVRDQQSFIDAIYSRCDFQSRTMLDSCRRDLQSILNEREGIAGGGLSDVDMAVDTSEEHINHISELSRRIQQLCPLVLRLDRRWDELNGLFDRVRNEAEGR